MTGQKRIDAAVAAERAKLERATLNVAAAGATGRLTEHDVEERVARLEQATANRIAYLKGEPRPAQRKRQPLDDPNAGRVG